MLHRKFQENGPPEQMEARDWVEKQKLKISTIFLHAF